jgi:RimJ/RimL family protein N-acetyltransferase
METSFIIKGARVNLRTMTRADIPHFEKWNDPDLKVWDYDGPWHNSRKVSMEAVRRRLDENCHPPYRTLEIETSEGIHIGFVVLHHRPDDPHIPEIGIRIFEETFWDRGLGTEALALWTDYLFREWNLTRVGFSTWSGNERVIAVGRKLGFVQEACIRRGCEVGGKFYDRIKMGILREEWEQKFQAPRNSNE